MRVRRLTAPLLLAPLLLGPALPVSAAEAAVTIQGPDVSSYQHPNGASINWAKVAKSGHAFAIVKATEGTSYVNGWFARDYAGIRKAGMVRGSYHFARPGLPVASNALAQARFYVSRLGTTTVSRTLPPALDLEQTGGLSPAQLVTWTQDFLFDVRALTGRTPIIYTYPWFWRNAVGDPAAFGRYPLWMAAYRGTTPDAGTTLWQYTAGATVSGIKGRVDMSRLLADPTTWTTLSDGTQPSPWPVAAPGLANSLQAIPGVGTATVAWLPPDAGSAPITSYYVTLAPADGSAPAQVVKVGATTSRATFTGLMNGAAYTYTVQARNAAGAGAVATGAEPVVVQSPTRLDVTGPGIVRYGDPAALQAVLTQADTGAPVAGAVLEVASRAHGGTSWTSYGTVVTDANGVATRSFTPGRNDDFRFSYAGDVGLAPVSGTTVVSVRKLVSAATSTPTAQLGQPVTISGSVAPAEARTRTALQLLTGGAWKNVQFTKTGTGGGFRFAVTPGAVGTSTWRLVVGSTPARQAGFAVLTLQTTA